ncbi:hypothetical protein RLEG3_00740 (plasmid) [Rhizobium leguminosarum bv. trifolii WSM1689]|jgi:hypothetical protein|nr:hypothetical protein RLEG3_00740 [Rhizobium leguminosarum bv. trifolii WSM1689]
MYRQTEDQSLAFDDLAKRHDGLLGCDGMVGDPCWTK